jgi:hypothetical protein
MTMRFHEYPLNVPAGRKPQAHYEQVARAVLAAPQLFPADRVLHLNTERNWLLCGQPFYHIFPGVVRALQNTNLDLLISNFPDTEAIAICFPEGHEPPSEKGPVHAMLYMKGCGGWDFREQRDVVIQHARIVAYCQRTRGPEGYTLLNVEGDQNLGRIGPQKFDRHDLRLFSIAAGVSLLAQDEEFVEPILLQRDRGRKLTPEQHAAAVERARKRGRRGFTIGAHWEVSPHVRRPHFAVRWCGAGRREPRLRPIKGSIVRRDHLYPIPTGYQGTPEPPAENSGNSAERPVA